MKKTSIIYIICLVSFFTAFMPLAQKAAAEVDFSVQQECAQTLNNLGIMLGDNSGNLLLENKITRTEFVTLVIRIMGYDRDTDISGIDISFRDTDQIKAWAVDYIKIAVKYNLLKGYTDSTIRPNNTVTNAEAQTILIRALGYGFDLQGIWPDYILKKSDELGLSKYMLVEAGHQLTRGESAVVIYNSLSIDFK
ncbi:MAG: S-layer homology domain-containing protein [Eubacteriales bacterium]|nr:S-layer homology domain-containing protein [Eubacteriales bacterium]